jgi:predicted amino acid-binding ACT domain protein
MNSKQIFTAFNLIYVIFTNIFSQYQVNINNIYYTVKNFSLILGILADFLKINIIFQEIERNFQRFEGIFGNLIEF